MKAVVFHDIGDVADIAWDARHGRIAVPLTGQNRVDFYRLPPP